MKKAPKISGIYGIYNRANGKWYVGQAKHIHKRNTGELWQLRQGERRAWNKRLQADFHEYGSEHFELITLEVCDAKVLDEREIYWVEKLHAYESGYNCTRGGKNGKGYVPAKDTIEKMKQSSAKRWAKPEEHEKMSKAKQNLSDETREKMRQSHLGKKQSPEQIEKRQRQFYKSVICIETGIIYESVKAAGKALNIDSSSIATVARKANPSRHTAGGYHWEYNKAKEI